MDDRSTAIKVSNHSLHRLRHVYGPHRLISLVSLIEAAQSSQTDVVPPAGRRLLALTHAAVAATSAKVWLWALPPKQFQLAAFLDLDVLVVDNIDEMLQRGLQVGKQ